MTTALVWFRRDLRLHDNPALQRAIDGHEQVIPVYLHAPAEEGDWAPGGAGRWWLHHSLTALDLELRARNSRLVLRRGSSLEALRQLIAATGATAIYWNRLYDPATRARDQTVKAELRAAGLHVESTNAALLFEPWIVHKDDGKPYQVFTRFWKACLRTVPPAAPLPLPETLRPPAQWPDSLPLAALELLPRIRWDAGLAQTWRPGEDAAHARLDHFCSHRLATYAEQRDRPGSDGVSRLSPHLHWGELSPRQVWAAVHRQTGGDALDVPAAETYLRELGWREFAHYVLYHWPQTPEQPLQERFAAYPWRDDDGDLLRAWQRGRTGIPLVDAGLRELWHTGWMHNRVRMIVASFLTKNCRIPWQDGARWFWDTLVDADLASNTLGWQWTAGCGTDAAPYFRVFNPVRQGERFDPDGVYVRRWVPELAAVPTPWLHQPWTLPAAERAKIGLNLGQDYPEPCVDLERSRIEALAGFERIKGA